MKRLLLIAATVLLISCDKSLDGKYVKDTDGNIYRLEWRIGVVYKPVPTDKEELEKIINQP